MRTDGVHLECVYAVSVPGMTVRNSTFRNCGVMDLFFLWGGWWDPQPPPYGNVTVENNIFGHVLNDDGSWNYYAVYIGQTGNDVLDGWVFRNYTFEQNVSVTTSHSRAVNSRWVGNLGGWDCVSGMQYSHNVGEKCGPTDKQITPNGSSATRPAPFGWLDPVHGDFRLAAGSPAIGAADPSDHPATDRNGFARDSQPDAGANEFGAGPGTGGGGASPAKAWRLRSARLQPKVICRKARHGCPASTKLRLRLGRPARVNVHVKRLRNGHALKHERIWRLPKIGMHKATRLRARGLAAGRYRIVVRAQDKSGRWSRPVKLTLKVR
jgi:hypothetical protein